MPLTFRLILAALCMFAGAGVANAQTDFYRAPRSEAAGAPGTLVRQEVIDGAPLGATAYRVLYRSTGLDNKPILVSGVVIVPPGDAPPGGRPIVAWAHPTSGIVPRCAPSLAIFLFEQIQGLRSFVRDGYVVAATDYPGLGTEGPHPYLVGTSEARAVIDSVRVAGSLPGAGGGKKFVVWGHSQGGHAALFSGGAGQGAKQNIVSTAVGQAHLPAGRSLRFLGYLAYALTMALAILAIILLVLLGLGPRSRRATVS